MRVFLSSIGFLVVTNFMEYFVTIKAVMNATFITAMKMQVPLKMQTFHVISFSIKAWIYADCPYKILMTSFFKEYFFIFKLFL